MGILALILLTCGSIAGSGQPPPYKAHLESEFYLNQGGILAIDNDFKLFLYSWDNGPVNYSILLDNEMYENGTFKHQTQINITTNKDLIMNIKAIVNGTTVYNRNNIIIYKHNHYNVGGDKTGLLERFQFTLAYVKDLQFNEFLAIITGFIMSLFFSYRIVSKYRKYKGVEQLAP